MTLSLALGFLPHPLPGQGVQPSTLPPALRKLPPQPGIPSKTSLEQQRPQERISSWGLTARWLLYLGKQAEELFMARARVGRVGGCM